MLVRSSNRRALRTQGAQGRILVAAIVIKIVCDAVAAFFDMVAKVLGVFA